MNITVTRGDPQRYSDEIVEFSSAFGSARGIWKGKERPSTGQQYDVEFTIPERLFWGTDITPADDPAPSISQQDGRVLLCGKVEFDGDDDTLAVKIGDSLVMLEVGNLPKNISGRNVCIRTRELELFDTGI